MDEIELIQKCRQGNYAAFEALYQLYVKRALRIAFLMTHSRTSAEDAAQEAFIQVWRRISTLREPGAFRPWFYRILLNTIHRLNRNEHRIVSMPLELDQHNKPDPTTSLPGERLEMSQEVEALRNAIPSLPDTHRIPLVLRYYSGLPEAEIAQVLEIPVGTVKSRLYNAKQALQRILAGPTAGSPTKGLPKSRDSSEHQRKESRTDDRRKGS